MPVICQPSAAATLYGELWGTQEEVKNAGCWPQIAEVHMKGILSVGPDSCILPNTEKC